MCFKVFDSMFVLVDLLEIWGFVKCNVECTVSQWLAVPRNNKVLGTNPFCVHFSPCLRGSSPHTPASFNMQLVSSG